MHANCMLKKVYTEVDMQINSDNCEYSQETKVWVKE